MTVVCTVTELTTVCEETTVAVSAEVKELGAADFTCTEYVKLGSVAEENT